MAQINAQIRDAIRAQPFGRSAMQQISNVNAAVARMEATAHAVIAEIIAALKAHGGELEFADGLDELLHDQAAGGGARLRRHYQRDDCVGCG